MNNMGFLFAAYSVIWLGVFIYVFFLLQREKKLWRDIETLQAEMKEKKPA